MTPRPFHSYSRPNSQGTQATPCSASATASASKSNIESLFPASASLMRDSTTSLKRHASPDNSPSKRSQISAESSSAFDLYSDPEVLELKRQLKELRRQCIDSTNRLELENIRQARELIERDKKVRDLETRNSELEGDRKLLFDHQKDWKGVAHKAEDSFLKERTELVSQLSTFRNQNSLLTEIVSKLQQEKRHEDSKYQLEIEQNLQTSLSLQAEITNLKEEINLVRQREKDKDWAYNASQTKLLEAERNVLELKHVSADSESVYQVRKELKDQMSHIKRLESQVRQYKLQNDHLSSQVRNIELLNEEKKSLEMQLGMMDSLRKHTAELEIQVSVLQREKCDWAAFLESHVDNVSGTSQASSQRVFDSPSSIGRYMASQQVEVLQSKDREGKVRAEMKAKENYIAQLEDQVGKLETSIGEWKERVDKDRMVSKRIEKSRELMTRELEFLRDQLKSYDAEECFSMPDFDQHKTKRIEDLESVLKEYKARITELEEQGVRGAQDQRIVTTSQLVLPSTPDRYKLQSSSVTAQIRVYEETLEALQKQLSMLERENNVLAQQLSALEGALGNGTLQPPSTRILQLTQNPESEEYAIRQSMLLALREENNSLLEIMNGRPEGLQLVPASSLVASQLEITKLKGLVSECEKRLSRTREIFQAKASEFIEAVHSLLGYKLEFKPDGRVQVVSMFSFPAERTYSFEFTSSEGNIGTMRCMGEVDADEVLKGDVNGLANEHGGIPALLSRVTLRLFESRGGRG